MIGLQVSGHRVLSHGKVLGHRVLGHRVLGRGKVLGHRVLGRGTFGYIGILTSILTNGCKCL